MERTVACKFCGRPVTGIPAHELKRGYKITKKITRILGSVSAAISGDPVTAATIATGKHEKAASKAVNYTLGKGVMYHFECKNPDCLQSFDKMVL